MAYLENFTTKLDWAMPFQRTGTFPLDRSSIFNSYADALKYAQQDGTDSRGLGGSSYVGQIISVYGNNETGTAEEISAYIITKVGEDANLMKLAQTTATGDFAQDIARIDAALGALNTRVTTVEETLANLDNDTDTTYEFSTGVSTDGSIHYIAKDKNGAMLSEGDIQVKGWSELVAIADGRTSAFVYQNKSDENYLSDITKLDQYKVGDIIYFKDTDIADQWVTATGVNYDGVLYEFADLETKHPDLTQYLTKTEASGTYATKSELSTGLNNKASTSDLEALSQTVTDNKAAADTAHQELQDAIDQVADDLSKIDVSAQITAKINELDSNNGMGGTQIGGADNSYITSIKQEDGIVYATASTFPDYDANAQSKADKALEDAKAYTDEKVASHSTEVETTINALRTELNGNISTVQSDLNATKETVSSHATKISNIETTVGTHTTSIGNLESEIGAAKTRISNVESKTQYGVVSDVKLGGVSLTKDAQGAVNISSISTDLLVTGSKTLILDCGLANGQYSE